MNRFELFKKINIELNMKINNNKNVLGTELQCCSKEPITGFFRDGYCKTNSSDQGSHVVASIISNEFLIFSKSMGNDLSSPNPLYNFPGLKKGDRWCVCAIRWKQAYDAGYAPFVVLEATHEKALEFIDLSALIEKSHDKYLT